MGGGGREGFEAADTVVHAVERGEEQNRRVDLLVTERPADFDAVLLRQHDVEHDHVVGALKAHRQTLLAVEGGIHGVALLHEHAAYELRKSAFIFYE